jgi:predicted ferric reductase
MSTIGARVDHPDAVRADQRNPGLRPPRIWSIRANDAVALIALNAVLIVAMWVRHGQLQELGTLAAKLTAAGQLSALLGTYAALIQILLMSRSPWLEQRFGMDGLARWHRFLGFACTALICAHVVLTVTGYALSDRSSVAAEAWTMLTTYPYVLMAAAATALLLMVAITSMRRARRHLRQDTWGFLHLYAYLAIALAFGHQLAVGSDFNADPVARGYWVGLYLAVAACLLVFRVGHPLRLSLRHRLRVAQIVPESPGVASIYVTGRHLDQLGARGGQYFKWRFLVRDGWWRSRPFSLSARANGQYLRLTVKSVGDVSREVLRLRPGTPIAVEGPYGVLTTLRQAQPKVLLIAGGIGITPLRALIEEIAPTQDAITLLYRARRWEEVTFQSELEQLVRERGGRIHYLIGRRGSPELPDDPFSPRALRKMVPDLEGRDVFLCGPPAMMQGLRATLHRLGVPDRQIHFEPFALI